MIWKDNNSWEKETYDIWELRFRNAPALPFNCALAANQINQIQK